MSIVLLGSTSGSCTLQEQAVAGTTVLTLPTTSGTVALTSQIPSSVGKVLQVIQVTNTTSYTNSSNTTPTDIISSTITPSSTSSRIYVVAQMSTRVQDANAAGNHEAIGQSILYRGSSVIDVCNYETYVSSEGRAQWLTVRGGHNFIDSPSTTNAVTYKVAIFSQGTGYAMYVPIGSNSGVTAQTGLILMEIAA